MLQEFKKFALRGNVMDMAIGIILGAAFGKIVASAVKDLIMPPIGMALGGVDFKDLAIPLQEAAAPVLGADGTVVTEAVAAVSINYGAFLNTVVDFLIIAFVIFMVVRGMNKMKKTEPAPEPNEKKCDFCKSTIDIHATRCPSCTSELLTAV